MSMDKQHLPLLRHRRTLFALLGFVLPLSVMADNVVVADANGNELSYTFDADGPATFTGINKYAADEAKTGRIIIADQVTDANGNSHEVKYIGGGLRNRSYLVSVVFGKNIEGTGGPEGTSTEAFVNCSRLESVTLNNKLKVLGTRTFSGCSKLASVNLDQATSLTTIMPYAFYNAELLRAVTLPRSVTVVGESAFYSIDSLRTVTIASGSQLDSIARYAFGYNYKLQSINLEAATKLKHLMDNVFYGCNDLAAITIPATVEEMGKGILSYCNKLKTVTFNAANVPASFCDGRKALATVNFGAGVKSIGERAFNNCDSLTAINFNASINGLAIGKQAFYDCDLLRTLTLSKGVVSLGESVFNSCDSLRTVTIATGSQLDSIAGYAFAYCYKLQSINLEAATQLKHLMYRVFYYCSALEAITVPAAVEEYANEYYGADFLGYCLGLKTITYLAAQVPDGLYRSYNDGKLTTINIGPGVKRIGNYAFANNYHLKTVNIDANVSGLTIGEYAFAECDALSGIHLPKGVTKLEKAAFRSCDSLGYVTFDEGSTITEIPVECFYYCYTGLQKLDLPNSVQTVGTGAFGYCRQLTEISFGTGLTTLPDDWYLFTSCDLLRKVTLPGVNYPFPRKIWMPDDVVLYVNAGLAEEYRSNAFTSDYRIVAIGEQNVFAVTTTAGGQLQDKLSEDQTQNLEELTITGPINGTDINYLHSSMPNLRVLNLKNARIVAGGDKYNQWNVAGNGVATVETYYGPWETEDNVVGYAMFYNMPALESLTLPNGTTKIGKYAMAQDRRHTWRLAEVVIPSSVIEIEDYAFWYSGIRQVTVPSGVTELKPYTFWHCEKLQKATLPDGIHTIGVSAFSECYELTDVNIPSKVVTINEYAFYNNYKRNTPVVIPNTCKTIGNYAFCYNYVMPSVTFGNSLEKVGYQAFRDCRLIEQAKLPETVTSIGNEAFYNCDSLRTFTFPQNIKEVPYGILHYCEALTSVTLADGTTRINGEAFADCPRLSSINITNQTSLTYTGNYVFDDTGFKTMTLPNSITEMGYCPFQNCHQLESVNVPTGIDYVPYDFCESCENLKSVKLHNGIRTIRHDAFLGCKSLESIDLNDQITTIEYSAFRNCEALQLPKLPDALTIIGDDAFEGTTALRGTLTIPVGVTSVGGDAFYRSGLEGVVFTNPATTIGTWAFSETPNLTRVVLPANLATVRDHTFYKAGALKSIDLPETVTRIENSAFDLSALESIELPENLNYLGDYAFASTQLRSFRLPDGFTSKNFGTYTLAYNKRLKTAYMGRNLDYTTFTSFTAFHGCDSLELLRLYAGTPPSCDAYYFAWRKNCVLEVPEDAIEAYQNSNYCWKEFKEIRGFYTGDELREQDFAVMQMLYEKLDGASWTQPWNMENNRHTAGKWVGVQTAQVGNTTTYVITGIDLSNRGLTGELPADLFRLKSLTALNISRNHIKGNVGEALSNIAADKRSPLTELNLQGNELSGDLYAVASALPQLTKLDASYNQFTDVTQPIDKTKLTNLSMQMQFVDWHTNEVVDPLPANAPVQEVTLGEAFTLEMPSLFTYRHNNQDFGHKPTQLARVYRSGGWQYDWEFYPTNGEMNLGTGNDFYFRGKKNQAGAYSDLESNWRTVLLRVNWTDGDVNVDQTVDVTDLQSVIYCALNDRKASGQLYNYTTADANGDNKIDVADVVGSVDYILNYSAPAAARARIYNNVYGNDNVLLLSADGLMLQNNDEVAALQFTVSGATQGQLRIGDDLRSQFSVAMRPVDDGVRVVVYSANGRTLAAGTHQLLGMLPTGATISNAVLSDPQARHLGVSIDGETTGISFVATESQQAIQEIFDLNGRRLDTSWDELPKGIYVVRMNGKQIKVKK